MQRIQEILILTNKGARHTIHIIKPNERTSFRAEIVVFDPDLNASYSSQVPISGSYKSSSEAFDVAFTMLKSMHNLAVERSGCWFAESRSFHLRYISWCQPCGS